jgi:hypothetical protein
MDVPENLKDIYRSVRYEYDDAREHLLQSLLVAGVSQETRDKAQQRYLRAMASYYALEDTVKAIRTA